MDQDNARRRDVKRGGKGKTLRDGRLTQREIRDSRTTGKKFSFFSFLFMHARICCCCTGRKRRGKKAFFLYTLNNASRVHVYMYIYIYIYIHYASKYMVYMYNLCK